MVLTPTVLPNSFGVPPDLSFPYLLQVRSLPRYGFCALEMPRTLLIPICLFAGCSFQLFCSSLRAPTETQRSGFGGKRTSDRESESCRLRRDEGFVVRSDDGGQHRICLVCGEAVALPNAPGGAWPHTPFSGRSPHPPSCERFCGNAFNRLRRRSFKGGPVPL